MTFVFVMLAWVFFRAQNFTDAVYIISHMFFEITAKINYAGFSAVRKLSAALSIAVLFLWEYLSLKSDLITRVTSCRNIVIRYACYFMLLTLVLLFRAAEQVEFVYFQF